MKNRGRGWKNSWRSVSKLGFHTETLYKSCITSPRATYRLQFNEHFRLADALALVPYLQELGVSHRVCLAPVQGQPAQPARL